MTKTPAGRHDLERLASGARAQRLSMLPQPFTADRQHRALAIGYGLVCHAAFVFGVGLMIYQMYFGLNRAWGPFGPPVSWIANALLLAQFPLGHSVLLSRAGGRFLARLAPAELGSALSTTTYVAIASLQVLLLFALWSPSGVVWWRASGWTLALLTGFYALSWLLLLKAMFDAGIKLQTGLLGWWSVLRGVRPRYPDMPTRGLFRLVRQPIYVAFSLTLWTVPTWTPDQLLLASCFTVYCLIGPRFKERRFQRLFGDRFRAYQRAVPYWLPLPRRGKPDA